MVAKNPEGKVKLQGLEDKGHVILSCSKCSKPIFSLWIIKDSDYEANYKAACPYCDGKSYTKKVKGRVSTGGIPANGDYYSDETEVLTFMDSWEAIEEDGEAVVLFKIGKK
jgi:DNA-directed RNA polymerase subunit RPC12/RpoP